MANRQLKYEPRSLRNTVAISPIFKRTLVRVVERNLDDKLGDAEQYQRSYSRPQQVARGLCFHVVSTPQRKRRSIL